MSVRAVRWSGPRSDPAGNGAFHVPRRTRIRSAPLEDLARQQRFSPPRAILKQIVRAESLAAEVDPAQSYPEEWVVFRITGYRPAAVAGGGDSGFEATIIPGAALIADLSAFVEQLSDEGGLDAAVMGEPLLHTHELCARWSVSAKTLERYRRQGLVARRMRDGVGHVRLGYSARVVEAFESRRAAQLKRAGAFERMPGPIRERIVRGARLYAGRLGWTLNQAAGRLARRYRVGHESARQLLLRHDELAAEPIFDRRPPLSVRERRVALRAYERGIGPGAIATRFGRSTPSVHRVINQRRAERIRRLPRPIERDASFALEGIEGSMLAPVVVREGLGDPFPTTADSLVALAHAMPPADAAVEHARAAAMQFLWWRATRQVSESMSRVPRSSELDRSETDLRWMLRLKAELLRAELPVVVRGVQERLGGRLDERENESVATALATALSAASAAIDRHDPFRGGRVAAPISLAISRALASEHALNVASGTELPDWSMRLTGWQSRFEPDARVRKVVEGLSAEEQRPLALRFGWSMAGVGSGLHPRTRREVMEMTGMSLQAQAGLLRRAMKLARTPPVEK